MNSHEKRNRQQATADHSPGSKQVMLPRPGSAMKE
jgi:hypothetical protein